MGVPIIENWARVSAQIVGVAESSEITGFSEVEMTVRRVEPVNDFPNLLEASAGTNLVVHFPSDLVEAEALETGNHVSCWVRKAGHARCFVHREHVIRLDSNGTTYLADFS